MYITPCSCQPSVNGSKARLCMVLKFLHESMDDYSTITSTKSPKIAQSTHIKIRNKKAFQTVWADSRQYCMSRQYEPHSGQVWTCLGWNTVEWGPSLATLNMSRGEALYRRSWGHRPVHEGLDPVCRGPGAGPVHRSPPSPSGGGQADMTETSIGER